MVSTGLAGLSLTQVGKPAPPYTNDSGFTDDINDLIRSKIVKITMWLYGFVQSIFSIRLNDNSHHLRFHVCHAYAVQQQLRSAYAGMYRSTDKAGSLTDLLANLHQIPHLNDRICRCAKML